VENNLVGSTGYVGEVTCSNDNMSLPIFPEKCPKCGAERISHEVSTWSYQSHAKYACGSEYKFKTQIQNHTNKWWFLGPCQRKWD
jgi:hypothetical protein